MKNVLFLLLFFVSYSYGELKPVDSIPDDIKSISAVIPIYSQKVSFQLPVSWKPAFQDQKPTYFMIEFTPKGESIENWKNLFSVQGFKNLSSKTTSKKFLENLASGFKSVCPESVVYEKLGSVKIDSHNASTAILGCGNMPVSSPTGVLKGQSEVGYYLSIEGSKDIYLFHKSVRGKSFSSKGQPVNKDNVKEFVAEFFPIELCKKDDHQGECVK